MSQSLTGGIAIITGAASGLGLAFAESLPAEGASVIIADLDEAKGEPAAQKMVAAGQTATVLQLPVAARHSESLETRSVAGSPDSRVALNRVPLRPGMASLLMPNQGTVMLWQTLRSAATGLSLAFVRLFRRLKARKQIDASFRQEDVLPVTSPKRAAGHKPEKKIELQAAA